jgi:hypothetical protein
MKRVCDCYRVFTSESDLKRHKEIACELVKTKYLCECDCLFLTIPDLEIHKETECIITRIFNANMYLLIFSIRNSHDMPKDVMNLVYRTCDKYSKLSFYERINNEIDF